MARQGPRPADAHLRGDHRLAVRLQVPDVGEREGHQVAGRERREDIGVLAGGAVEDRVGHDAVQARVRPGGDRGVPGGRDGGRVRHPRVIERRPLASEARQRGQLGGEPIEVVRAHAVEDQQQHGPRRTRAGDERLVEGPSGGARQHDAEHAGQRRGEVLLRHGRAERPLPDAARTPEQERDAHVVVPGAAVHEVGPAARDELALLRDQGDLAAAARVVGPREHRERRGSAGAPPGARRRLRPGGRPSRIQEEQHREGATKSHLASGARTLRPLHVGGQAAKAGRLKLTEYRFLVVEGSVEICSRAGGPSCSPSWGPWSSSSRVGEGRGPGRAHQAKDADAAGLTSGPASGRVDRASGSWGCFAGRPPDFAERPPAGPWTRGHSTPIREERLLLIPRHWSKVTGSADDPGGKRYALRIWGWSADSVAEAATLARRRLADACARVASGALRDEAYFYGKVPLREEIVRTVGGDAIVTRNRYGALVLNTARVPFVDVDTPASGSGSGGGLLGLFGGKQADPASAVLDRVRAACGRFPRTSFRIYRTAAGFRLLATDLLLDPASAQAQELLADFSADPFFVKLCRLQASFRARLTPKPWRCGCALPPASFPREPRPRWLSRSGCRSTRARSDRGRPASWSRRRGRAARCRKCRRSSPSTTAPVAWGRRRRWPEGQSPARSRHGCVATAEPGGQSQSSGVAAGGRPVSRSRLVERRLQPCRRHRQSEEPRAGRVEDGVGDHGAHRDDRRLAAALRASSSFFTSTVSICGQPREARQLVACRSSRSRICPPLKRSSSRERVAEAHRDAAFDLHRRAVGVDDDPHVLGADDALDLHASRARGRPPPRP